ncbi:MAG: thermonuclease family protein [Alphaproteobacteria bacterium]|nr:thermonuclease family protein [Alphaproteobacteria bacterium]
MVRCIVVLMVAAGLGGVAMPALADWPPQVTGTSYRVVDGDTIHLEGEKIRLLGIDAPEMKQRCQERNGAAWACGVRARDMLAGMLATADQVSCTITGRDRYQRLLGRCYAGDVATGLDVQKALVLGGFAVAEYTDDYRNEERQAKRNGYGFWGGEFLRPRDWRRK